MELGEALKYFFSKAKIIITHSNYININLLSYFPLLKRGYGLSDTIKNIFKLYIKINKLNKENKIMVDDLFKEAFNDLIPVSNYKVIGNSYCLLINLYEYIAKYEKFEYINLFTNCDYINLVDCPEPLKLQYNNLVNSITEFKSLKTKDFISAKEIYIKNYVKYDIQINTFDFIKSINKDFDYQTLNSCNINDVIDLNVLIKESKINRNLEELRLSYDLEKELDLSNELIKILRLIERDNVFEAAIIRNNNSHIKIIDHDYNDLKYYLINANYNKYYNVLRSIFNSDYFKLLNAVLTHNSQEVYKCLYELNVDPRGNENDLYHLSKIDEIKEMISDVSIKKNLIQQTVISNIIEELIGNSDIPNNINSYINKLL